MSGSLRPHGLYSPWNSPGQNTGVGNLSLLQGIFPTQGSNPGLPHCSQTLYQLSHNGSPSILEWVAYPFSRGSSWPRNWTRVSCIAGGLFTNWAMREAQQDNGEGNGTPLQYSCLENPKDRGAWWAAVHGAAKSWTRLHLFFTFMRWRRKWQPIPVFLTGESQGQGSLVGCPLWGRKESDMTEAT